MIVLDAPRDRKRGYNREPEGEVGEALEPLVSTKLRPSQPRPRLVGRPRLSERLDPEAGRKLTLVSAPAGFGKTTLVGKWAEDRVGGGHHVAWLSLDEGDNDPTRFWVYVVESASSLTSSPRYEPSRRGPGRPSWPHFARPSRQR